MFHSLLTDIPHILPQNISLESFCGHIFSLVLSGMIDTTHMIVKPTVYIPRVASLSQKIVQPSGLIVNLGSI